MISRREDREYFQYSDMLRGQLHLIELVAKVDDNYATQELKGPVEV